MVAAGISADDIMATIHERAEERNRAAQLTLNPPSQSDEDFSAREVWLHDGQPIYGELKVFAHAAYVAAKAGNQAEFSRQNDLLYKAVLTFAGIPVVEGT